MQEFTAIVEVDSQGRVTIPPVIRKALKLQKGSIITIAIREINFKIESGPLIAAKPAIA